MPMDYITIATSFFCLFLLCYSFRNKNGLPTNWPIIGMLPAILLNINDINTYIASMIEKAQFTFLVKGPWFSNIRLLLTVDPTNVHHVMSKNFDNYPKGSKFNEIFDILGDGHINRDSNLWRYHRRIALSFFNQPNFNQLLLKKTYEKVENGLMPILDHVSKLGLEIDLQDIFERFTFDFTCSLILSYDHGCLSLDLPFNAPSRALDDIEEVFFYRHAIPSFIWKFQRWICVGEEKRYKKAWEVLDDFVYKCISRKKKEMMNERSSKENKGNDVGVLDLLTIYMDEIKSAPIEENGDKFLRDIVLNFLIAGRDTTGIVLSWFFYVMSMNPQILSKIKEELDSVTSHVNEKDRYNYLSTNFEKLVDKLVYLHGALCEVLRLYPPVTFQSKSPIKEDILPSGHVTDPSMLVMFNIYAMGRMKSIWGDDCYEFKPERWISERGNNRFEPSYKFLAFNAGPRICVGKAMAFIQMKVIAAFIIQNYHIQAVEGCQVVPTLSIILRMKHGFKVKVFKK